MLTAFRVFALKAVFFSVHSLMSISDQVSFFGGNFSSNFVIAF
jgi:hypothetical protein